MIDSHCHLSQADYDMPVGAADRIRRPAVLCRLHRQVQRRLG